MNSKSSPPEEPIVRRRMPELDTIRGIAILSVLMFHGFEYTAWLTVTRPGWQSAILAVSKHGWAGVNLFFVLSGFLITGILLDGAGKPRYYSRFYAHRALRILPAYYLMLLILLVGNYFAGVSMRATLAFVGVSFIYLSNLSPMFGVSVLYPLLWSLSVEEHFYLIWPMVVRLFAKRGVAIVAFLICVIDPALRLYALSRGTELWWAGPSQGGSFRYSWMMADGLALGALLALFARSAWGTRNKVAKLALIAGAVAVAATIMCVLVPQALAFCLRGTSVNYYSLAIVAGALWLGTGVHRRWVNIPLLAFYGYISYGLYLVHDWMFGVCGRLLGKFFPTFLPVADFARSCVLLAVGVVVSTAVAYLSRVTYEEFFLKMKEKTLKTPHPERVGAAA